MNEHLITIAKHTSDFKQGISQFNFVFLPIVKSFIDKNEFK